MPNLDDLTPEQQERLIKALVDSMEECGRQSIYYAPEEGTHLCGAHSAWFHDWELESYDGIDTCQAILTS